MCVLLLSLQQVIKQHQHFYFTMLSFAAAAAAEKNCA
jgi:hypothetical protein